MTPTNRLRWLKKQHKDRPYADMTLQQWWATDPDCYEDWVMKVNGEWRDVPIEEQA